MRYLPGSHQLPVQRTSLAGYKSQHFGYEASNGIATITLNRPERKNPLTFESYAELRDLFRLLGEATDIKAVVLTGAGENFCSGGDVHEIIGPLTKLDMPGLLTFTRLTGDLVKAIRACPQPVIAAIDGACAGAGALLALASIYAWERAAPGLCFYLSCRNRGLRYGSLAPCLASSARPRSGAPPLPGAA
jgi:enoyl-CoA hydratase/carnithine racemase